MGPLVPGIFLRVLGQSLLCTIILRSCSITMSFARYITCLILFALFSEQAPLFERSISPAPAIASNFPDPTIIEVNGVWFAFSTNANGLHIPVAKSFDFINWSVTGTDALPVLGAWTVPGGGGVWAPSVTQLVRVQIVCGANT